MLGVVPVSKAQSGTGTFRVATTGTDTPTCGSVATPCRTIQYAVDLVPIGGGSGTILVAAGTYVYTGSGTSQTGREVVRILSRYITITGGYTTAFDISDPAANVTIIDGQNARRAISVEPFSTLTLTGVTLTNGRAPQDAGTLNSFGGALNAYSAIVTMTQVKVTNSAAIGLNSGSGEPGRGAGGGLSFRETTAFLSDVELSGNVARGGGGSGSALRGGLGVGGGLFALGNFNSKNCSLSINNLTARNNTAQGGSAPGSGGVDSGGIQRADGLGGAVSLIDCSNPSINGLTLADNTAQGGQAGGKGGLGLGGGLFLERIAGTVRVNSGEIRDSEAKGGTASEGGAGLGGAIFSTETKLTLDSVAMLSNVAEGVSGGSKGGDGAGGGIYVDSAAAGVANNLVATNVIIGDNEAVGGPGGTAGFAFGGGLFFQAPASSSSVTGSLTHVTLANNLVRNGAFNQGAALFTNAFSGRQATVTSHYGIVAGHTSAAAVRANGTAIFNYTLWDGNNSKNDGTGSFQDNFFFNGSVDFVDPAANPPDFHLKKTSAAIDKVGPNTSAIDIDGQDRPYRPTPGTGVNDVGADEYYSPVFLTVTVVNSTTLKLNWTPFEDAGVAGYQIVYQLSGGANPPAEGASPIPVPGDNTTDTFTLTGLSQGLPYSLTVEAIDGGNAVVETSNLAVATPADLLPTFLPLILKSPF